MLLRFAPSPTGSLHLGGLRTALFNHLLARQNNGKWILRIEDTDATRYVPGSVDDIRKSLEWAGLEYDYGPGRDGPHGPYFQSERLDLYRAYSERLLLSGHAYRCFCSPTRLAATREQLAKKGSNSTYDKTCLNLTEEEVARRVRSGEKSIVRLNDGCIPPRASPPDLIFGEVKDAHASLPTDPVLLKSDHNPTYHLASVVDDHEMGITHVLRGEEWLPSLPLHLDLYACLSILPPQFAHMPILLNADRSKMSKRKGDVRVADYIERGWEPSAVLSWLAQAGRGTAGEDALRPPSTIEVPEVLTLPELIQHFRLGAFTNRRTILDPTKLTHLNKLYLQREAQTTDGFALLYSRARRLLEVQYPDQDLDQIDLRSVLQTIGGRYANVNDIPTLLAFLFRDPDYSTPTALAVLETLPSDIYHQVLADVISKLDAAHVTAWDEPTVRSLLERGSRAEKRQAMSVLRHALTGEKAGLGVVAMVQLLGRHRTAERLRKALDFVGSRS